MSFNNYKLEKNKGVICPKCKQPEAFRRYVNLIPVPGKPKITKEVLVNEEVGVCRLTRTCGYSLLPLEHEQKVKEYNRNNPKYIPQNTFQKSLSNYEENNFSIFLIREFGVDKANEAIDKYFIGTSRTHQGASLFWRIDSQDRIRTGRRFNFDPMNGKVVPEDVRESNCIHYLIYKDFNLIPPYCLFGEHLLKEQNSKVIILKYEFDAVLASILYPNYTWLASSGYLGKMSDLGNQIPNVTIYNNEGFENLKIDRITGSRLINGF